MANKALYWFERDLRLADNPALNRAAEQSDELLCVYCLDPALFEENAYGFRGMGERRWQFLLESLWELRHNLEEHGQRLLVVFEAATTALPRLIQNNGITHAYRARGLDASINDAWLTIKAAAPAAKYEQVDARTLYVRDKFDFSLEQLPASFGEFHRKVVKAQPMRTPVPVPDLPGMVQGVAYDWPDDLPDIDGETRTLFTGGESAAHAHLQGYFTGAAPAEYLDHIHNVTALDRHPALEPWLAFGNLSPRQVVSALHRYESEYQTSASTEHIFEEMMLREYFLWMGLNQTRALLDADEDPPRIANAEGLRDWTEGRTDEDLVNGCMRLLNAAGYLPPAGKEVVASYLLNESGIDYRAGVAYFAQQSLDYEPGLTYAMWQHWAGAGSDPSGKLWINIPERRSSMDPDQSLLSMVSDKANFEALRQRM